LANPALTVGILSGLVISPDLDVDHGFIGLAHLRRLPGGIVVSYAWRAFWYPYSKIVPHRSHISHSIIFGTLAREKEIIRINSLEPSTIHHLRLLLF
jgi:uncharacterized metal-binding protein